MIGPEGWTATEAPARLEQLKRNCNTNRQLARYRAAHNQNHAFVMAMIEAWRAVDSSFDAHRAGSNALADWAQAFFPMFVKGIHRWLTRNTKSPDGSGSWLYWHGADGVPEEFVSTEDTSHAELSMRFLGVLYRSIERINRALPPGQQPIDLSPM